MALLRPYILRLATYGVVVGLSLHYLTLLIFPTSRIAALLQTAIAAIALGSLIGIVLADYRRGGALMRHIEEEVLVISIFGLFWLSFAVVLRVYGARGQPFWGTEPAVAAHETTHTTGRGPIEVDVESRPKVVVPTQVRAPQVATYKHRYVRPKVVSADVKRDQAFRGMKDRPYKRARSYFMMEEYFYDDDD
ncbi:hypothetical protein FRC03_002520 [Tulasnella sp. 419]|nr:hypothetical protein FRC02_001477 [Tulasnella sp. 418]KAG8963836.1 hypothetical protein FRC03_002520 [Tulasnella sp. 419]